MALDLFSYLLGSTVNGGGGGGKGSTPFKSLTLEEDGSYTAIDWEDNEHVIEVEEEDGRIVELTYDGKEINIEYDDNGNLVKVGNSEVDVEEYIGVGIVPTGDIEITENGEYDVTAYETATVNVASGSASGNIKLGKDFVGNFMVDISGSAEGYDNNNVLLCTCDDFEDSSPYGFTLTNNGVEIDTSVKKFGTGSWHFVENTDYVAIDNPRAFFDFGSGNFTIDLWFYPTAFTGGIIGAWSSYGQTKSFLLTTAGTAGLLFACNNGGSSTKMIQTENNVLTLNQWQHLAVTRSTDTIYVFINGTMVKSENVGSTYTINPFGSNLFWIGKNSDNYSQTDHTTGYIDEIRILKGICAWTSDFTPPTQPY